MSQTQQARQSQGQSQKQITFSQSLACAKMLLGASIGCISHLRGLLPEGDDNFEYVEMGAANKQASSSSSSATNSGFRFRKIKPGVSDQGDRILQYLEEGAYKALESKFLKSMILAIYLDPADPSNVIETYTFNFSYHNVPGVGLVPLMSVEKDTQTLRAGGQSGDAVFSAATSGRELTVEDVKGNVKTLLDRLMLSTETLEQLPRKRYLSMKLFYNPDTPEDYEPSMFRTAHPKADKFIFGTHAEDEIPDIRPGVGASLGYHGMHVTVRSIVHKLPQAHDAPDQNAIFGEEAEAGLETEEGRKADAEAQKADQISRDVMWNAEDQVDQGQDDLVDGDRASVSEVSSKSLYNAPFAERVGPGQFKPYLSDTGADQADRQSGAGGSKRARTSLGDLSSPPGTSDRASTGSVQMIQLLSGGVNDGVDGPAGATINQARTSNSGAARSKKKAAPSSAPATGRTKKTVRLVRDSDDDEDPTVDDSQTQSTTQPTKSASKAAPKRKKPAASRNTSTADARRASASGSKKAAAASNSLNDAAADGHETQCWCGDTSDAQLPGPEAQCNGCDRWMHFYCHGGQDKAEVEADGFSCAKCELKKDPRANLLSLAEIDQAIQAFRTLALFRRALRVTYNEDPIENVGDLAQRLACGKGDAQSMLNRLEDEGFIRRISGTPLGTAGSSNLSSKKRINFKAVKHEKTRKAEKAYFDRTTRAKEDHIWKLNGPVRPHATPSTARSRLSLPTPLSSQFAQLHGGDSSGNAVAGPSSASSAQDNFGPDGSPPIQPGSVASQSEPARTPTPAASSASQAKKKRATPAKAKGKGREEGKSTSASSKAKGKRKTVDNARVKGEAMSLPEAMAASGADEIGQGKRIRASVCMEGIDICY